MKKPIIILIVLVLIIGAGYLSDLAFGQVIRPSGTWYFWRLFDTPDSYTSQAGKGVRVNTAEDAVEFFTLSLGDFDSQTAWRVFYSNTDGDVTELALGTNGQYLKSNGASSAPTWSTIAGGGDLLADGTVPLTDNWDVGNFDITLKSLTGDGTIEGATLTEGGTGVYNITESDAAYQPLESTLTDIADGTIAENLVNTANPWADNEVADNITIDLATLATTLTITDNESTNENNPVVFVAGADPDGGNLSLETDGDYHYNPSTGTLTAMEYAGGGASLTAIDAATGDSATAFFDAGTIEHEYGGLEADINAYTGLVAITGGSTAEVDSKSELEGHIADVADFAEADGETWTGTHDLSGAAVTMPKRTKNDDKFYTFNLFNPNSLYDTDTQVCFEPNLPANITITEVQISCDADPATELDIDLKFADAFIGLANATLIEPIDTTNGTTDIDSGFDDATVAAGKCLYVEFAADPDSNIKQAIVKIRYDFD